MKHISEVITSLTFSNADAMQIPKMIYPIYVDSLDFEGNHNRPKRTIESEQELRELISFFLPNHAKHCVLNGFLIISLNNQ